MRSGRSGALSWTGGLCCCSSSGDLGRERRDDRAAVLAHRASSGGAGRRRNRCMPSTRGGRTTSSEAPGRIRARGSQPAAISKRSKFWRRRRITRPRLPDGLGDLGARHHDPTARRARLPLCVCSPRLPSTFRSYGRRRWERTRAGRGRRGLVTSPRSGRVRRRTRSPGQPLPSAFIASVTPPSCRFKHPGPGQRRTRRGRVHTKGFTPISCALRTRRGTRGTPRPGPRALRPARPWRGGSRSSCRCRSERRRTGSRRRPAASPAS